MCWTMTVNRDSIPCHFTGLRRLDFWIAFIAYQDSQVFGMLCFGTCLFTYVYIFMNLEETRRPAALTGLGFVFIVSGLLVR